MRALYWMLGLIDFSAVERYTTFHSSEAILEESSEERGVRVILRLLHTP